MRLPGMATPVLLPGFRRPAGFFNAPQPGARDVPSAAAATVEYVGQLGGTSAELADFELGG